MKKLLSLFFASLVFSAVAAVDAIVLFGATPKAVETPAKVVAVRALSSVDNGNASVKAVSSLYAAQNDIVTSYFTNTTYVLVWSNGVNVVTNTAATDRELFPLPPPRARISFTTNAVVSSVSKTNVVQRLVKCVTNEISSVTCSGGYGTNAPSGKSLYGGDRVFFTGTAKGRVEILIER